MNRRDRLKQQVKDALRSESRKRRRALDERETLSDLIFPQKIAQSFCDWCGHLEKANEVLIAVRDDGKFANKYAKDRQEHYGELKRHQDEPNYWFLCKECCRMCIWCHEYKAHYHFEEWPVTDGCETCGDPVRFSQHSPLQHICHGCQHDFPRCIQCKTRYMPEQARTMLISLDVPLRFHRQTVRELYCRNCLGLTNRLCYNPTCRAPLSYGVHSPYCHRCQFKDKVECEVCHLVSFETRSVVDLRPFAGITVKNQGRIPATDARNALFFVGKPTMKPDMKQVFEQRDKLRAYLDESRFSRWASRQSHQRIFYKQNNTAVYCNGCSEICVRCYALVPLPPTKTDGKRVRQSCRNCQSFLCDHCYKIMRQLLPDQEQAKQEKKRDDDISRYWSGRETASVRSMTSDRWSPFREGETKQEEEPEFLAACFQCTYLFSPSQSMDEKVKEKAEEMMRRQQENERTRRHSCYWYSHLPLLCFLANGSDVSSAIGKYPHVTKYPYIGYINPQLPHVQFALTCFLQFDGLDKLPDNVVHVILQFVL